MPLCGRRLENEMLLLNVTRMHHHLPDHYTVTSAIAATFDYRINVGFGAELPGFNTGQNKFAFNILNKVRRMLITGI